MSNQAALVDSQKPLLQRKGFWIETAPNGKKLYCHKVRLNGKKIFVKKTLSEIAAEMDKVN